MKILRSIHSLNPAVGGPIESVRQSSASLQSLGHEIEIVTLDPPDAPWLGAYDFKIHAVGPGLGSYGYTSKLTQFLKTTSADYDAVVVHGIWQWNSFGVWRALRGKATPYFVFPHGMLDPWFNRTYPRKRLKKNLYWRWGEFRVLRDAAAVLFTSEEEKLLAGKSFTPYRCNEVVVNYGTASPACDLDSAREKFTNRFPELRGKRVVLFLSRLHEKKGADLLIEAFAQFARDHDDIHLVIAGPASDEIYSGALRQLASERGAAVTFTGMLSGDEKWGAFAAADVFVLPSHQENFGIAVAESLACGTPVLVSDKVNIWREIVHDKAGFADSDDVAGTLRLLTKWFQLPAAQVTEMRVNARRCFDARFEIRNASESLLAVLDRYVSRPH